MTHSTTHGHCRWLPTGAATLSLGILLLMLASCGDRHEVLYSHFVDIPPSGMPRDWVYTLLSPADSLRLPDTPVDVVVTVRYNHSCPLKRLPLAVEAFPMDTDTLRQPVFELFDREGRPLGHGTYGIYQVSDTIMAAVNLPEGLTVLTANPLPSASTGGIVSLGITVSRH